METNDEIMFAVNGSSAAFPVHPGEILGEELTARGLSGREFAKMAGSLSISPDNEGYFGYLKDFNAYIEIKSYKKVISDAKMRNQIFFRKLGLD